MHMRIVIHLFGAVLLAQVAVAAALNPRKTTGLAAERTRAQNAELNNWVVTQKKARDAVKPKEPKYFHEPGVAEAGHYDSRFYNGTVPEAERQAGLKHLIHAWLQWTQSYGLETWLAHGTLLGWWWNAQILPWDTDLDVQVSEATLKTLATTHNMTTWVYSFDDDDDAATQHSYLLDVNPHWVNRTRSSFSNLIDARWVDTSTGMFIDITGLSETQPDMRPGIISCKNLHRYHVNDIYPLRVTQFENYKAYIPFAFDKVLMAEYRSRAFTLTEYNKYEWQPALKSWVKKEIILPRKVVALKSGKTMSIKEDDPRGLEAVPQPTLMQNLDRLVNFWK